MQHHHHHHPNMAPHYFVRSLMMAGFSFYVVYLVKIDKLHYYIAPRMMPYVKYTAIGLFVLAGYFMYLAIRHTGKEAREEEACDCGHEPPKSLLRNIFLYSLFAIPLLLGFGLPDQIMGSDIVAVKGISLNVAGAQQAKQSPVPTQSSSAAADPALASPGADSTISPAGSEAASSDPANRIEEPADTAYTPTPDTNTPVSDASASDTDAKSFDEEALDKLFPAEEYDEEFAKLGKRLYQKDVIQVKEEGFLELLTALDMYRDNFVGKTLEISGFVYREDDMDTDQFVVARMAMQCCSADAMPYGFLVKWGRGADLEKDTWITLTGVIGLTDYNGNEIIELDARKMTKIEAPKDPYVYPFFDDFGKLSVD